jgi:hypothetical protein
MRFFTRGQDDVAKGDFWTWWSGGARERIVSAIASGGLNERLVAEVNRAVLGIHPGMAWELAPGRVAEHAFCVSPDGNAEVRQAALRWLDSGPPADATWEYHASRQPWPTLRTLQVGSWQFELGEMRAISSWDETHGRVDVRLWHPKFPDLPNETRLQVAFLFLDNLLGEDEVERWIGTIDLLDAPSGGRTPEELRAEVARRSEEGSGDATWILGQLTRPDGRTTIVTANAGVKRIDHPFADHHVTIGVILDGPIMPTDDVAAVLNAEEDDLLERLGEAAAYVGRTTTPGLRQLHFVTRDPELMRPGIDGWAAALPDTWTPGGPQRRIKVDFQHDMSWAFREDLGLS